MASPNIPEMWNEIPWSWEGVPQRRHTLYTSEEGRRLFMEAMR